MASGTIDGKYYDNIPTPEDWGRAQGELADLQRQLRQAQEERDGWKRLADFAVPRMEAAENCVRVALALFDDFTGKEDAAIERGCTVWDRCAWFREIVNIKHRRAVVAEKELAEQKVPVPNDPNPCPRCGKRYGLCASVSSEDWFAITGHWNGGGHLCLWCMDALAAEKGLSGIHCTLSFAGRAIWSDDDPVEEACQANSRAGAAESRIDGWAIAMRQANQVAVGLRQELAEQRALAEAKDALIQEGLDALDSYQVTSRFDEALALTPAEALSPQSGQEESTK